MKINPQQGSITASGIQTADRCIVCNKAIIENAWFCRLPQKADEAANFLRTQLLICSPWCALLYFGFLDGASQNLDDKGGSSHIHK